LITAVVKVTLGKTTRKGYLFHVQTASTKFSFAAKTAEERSEWLQLFSFSKCISLSSEMAKV
jgi:hypothetical protein